MISLLRYFMCLSVSHVPARKRVLAYSPVCVCVCVCVFQIEDIRTSIDKIDESVTEIKKLYSTILSAPTSDQSKCHCLSRLGSVTAKREMTLW